MDIYHIWANLKPGSSDIQFAENLDHFLSYLKNEGKIESWRLMRRKLGLGPQEFGEFHIMIETQDLAQLDQAFNMAASRTDPNESHHFHVNHMVADIRFALYRDFPDSVRKTGQEKF